MDELTIGDKIYISSKRAAAITGYAKDYVGQLCREGQVEAKMVGRSWYVLESSIRAHRFGRLEQSQSDMGPGLATEAEAETGAGSLVLADARNDLVTRTWEAPKYVAEDAPAIPELMPGPTPEPIISDARETAQSLDMSDDRESLSEMQAAWKEWFENKQEPTATTFEPADREAEAAAEESPEEEEADNRTQNAEDEEAVAPEVAEESVPVVVHRIPEPRPAVHIEIPPKPVVRAPARTDSAYEPDGVVIREKRVRRGSRGPTNLVYGTIMVVVAGIVIAIALIGSGFADTYLGNNPVIEYLGGASSISK